MVNFMMSVNRFCGDCMKHSEFIPLRFVMININSGMWMCPKTECIFPMNSDLMKEYIEEDMTTEKVFQLTKMGRKRCKSEKKNVSAMTKDNLLHLQRTGCSRNLTSEEGSYSLNTSVTNYSNSSSDDRISSLSSFNVSKKTIYYPLWENTSLLCWLDSVLAMLVLNQSMGDLLCNESSCLIANLFVEYKKILISFNRNLNYNYIKKQMGNLRNNILMFFQPKLLANFGDEDSPLVCLPLVLGTSKRLLQAVEMSYSCIFKCENCGFERTDGFQKVVMSLPNTNIDLNFNDNIYYSRCCYKCFTDHQKTKCKIERYPLVMFVHFSSGVISKRCWMDFNFVTPEGDKYIVTQIVQFLNRKRHFVTWSYSYEENKWIEADDLKDPVVYHKYDKPRCRPQEVHLVIWERVALLESLVQANKRNADLSESNSSISGHGRCLSTSSVLSSDDLLLRSGSSSKRSSLCNGDSLLSKCSVASNRSNPYKNVKHVMQKGLRNTPRYEPYVSRADKKVDSKLKESPLSSIDNANESDNSKRNLDTLESGNAGTNVDIQNGASCNGVSVDFLKGVLSEELNALTEDFLSSTGNDQTLNSSQNLPIPSQSLPEAYSEFSADGDLNDLYSLLNG